MSIFDLDVPSENPVRAIAMIPHPRLHARTDLIASLFRHLDGIFVLSNFHLRPPLQLVQFG